MSQQISGPTFPYHIPELDFNVMMGLDDDTLQSFCEVDQYVKGLCETEWFIDEREKRKFDILLKYQVLYDSTEDFYKDAYKDACYIVRHPEGVYAFADIKDAYNK